MRILLAGFLVAILLPVTLPAAPRNTIAPATPAQKGFRAEFLADLADVERKLVGIAEATPAAKYTWRPAPDVRSISEVFMHIAGSNYFLATFIGADAPPLADNFEKSVTRKADVIAELKRSFEHLRTALRSVEDLEAAVRMFGNQTTHRGVLVTTLSHLHEHLGQLIVYSRMNGIVPPWSK
jgi:uncharacterized damage-inducible protein DinB